MNTINPKYPRILAIAPSARGFGFAVHEGQDTLVDWGGKQARPGNKNAWCLAEVEKIIAHYKPEVMVLENLSTKDSKRSPRIRALSRRIIALAARYKARV